MAKDKKILVVYYSRTGSTRAIAKKISAELNCENEEIVDSWNRRGPIGFFFAGMDAFLLRRARIKETKLNPNDYDLIVLGTPNWSSHAASAVKTYVDANKQKFAKIALFGVCNSSGNAFVFKELAMLCGKEPVATLSLKKKEVEGRTGEDASSCQNKLIEFTTQVRIKS